MATPAIIERGNSLSSSLITGVTLYRNQDGTMNKILGEVGYCISFATALVETVAAAFFTVVAGVFSIFTPSLLEYSLEWLKSSAFSITWSFGNVFLNLIVVVLVANESSAREVVTSGNFLNMPIGAQV